MYTTQQLLLDVQIDTICSRFAKRVLRRIHSGVYFRPCQTYSNFCQYLMFTFNQIVRVSCRHNTCTASRVSSDQTNYFSMISFNIVTNDPRLCGQNSDHKQFEIRLIYITHKHSVTGDIIALSPWFLKAKDAFKMLPIFKRHDCRIINECEHGRLELCNTPFFIRISVHSMKFQYHLIRYYQQITE